MRREVWTLLEQYRTTTLGSSRVAVELSRAEVKKFQNTISATSRVASRRLQSTRQVWLPISIRSTKTVVELESEKQNSKNKNKNAKKYPQSSFRQVTRQKYTNLRIQYFIMRFFWQTM